MEPTRVVNNKQVVKFFTTVLWNLKDQHNSQNSLQLEPALSQSKTIPVQNPLYY